MAKIGEGHAEAMLRAGAKELAQALVALPDSNIRPVEEPGLIGNPTQIIVTDQMIGEDAHLEGAADYGYEPEQELEYGD